MTEHYMPDLSSLEYKPQHFRDLADTELGGGLWAFLKRPDNLIRMETATLLDRAAVEPLAAGLVFEFGDEVRDDRTKQMIGHMTRKVMEALGYELDRTGLRMTKAAIDHQAHRDRQGQRGGRRQREEAQPSSDQLRVAAHVRPQRMQRLQVRPLRRGIDGGSRWRFVHGLIHACDFTANDFTADA